MSVLTESIRILDQIAPLELRGRVAEVQGLALRVADLPVPVGAMVRIVVKSRSRARSRTENGATSRLTLPSATIEGEVIGFDHQQTIVMPLGPTTGIGRGDLVIAEQFAAMARVGESLLGRVLDGMGRPIDDKGPLSNTVLRSINSDPADPLDRPLINQPLATGIRAIDSLISIGRGQRLGVFSPPGVGKTTLMGLMARHTAADVTVLALVGERGREVRDFVQNHLGEDGLAKSVVVCAASDEPALMRIHAALVATTIAEYFRDHGLDVLLIMDSITRFCHAARQVGLAAGEPPTTKGFTPSVFSLLPLLLERSGRMRRGSITGLYAVLVEGDELTDPISDAARGVLDGHVMLSKQLANRGHWPAIDVVQSVSRVVDDVTDTKQQAARRKVLRLIDAYTQVEDLLNIGAYTHGSNHDFDVAIACKPAIDRLLQQGLHEVDGPADFERTRNQLLAMVAQIDKVDRELKRKSQPRPPGLSAGTK